MPVPALTIGVLGMFLSATSAQGCSGKAREAIPALFDTLRVYHGARATTFANELFYFRKRGAPSSEDYEMRTVRWSANGQVLAHNVLDLGGPSDLYPTMSRDGRRLVFASYRRAAGDQTDKPSASIWFAERRGTSWGPPTFVDAARADGYYHSHLQFGPDGRLYFQRTSPDWRSTESYVMSWNGRAFDAPVRWLPGQRFAREMPGFRVYGAYPGPDTSTVIIEASPIDSVTRRTGPGQLWVSQAVAGRWSAPQLLGAGVNDQVTGSTFPFFAPDGCELWFTRGFSRIFRVSFREALNDAK